MLALAELVLAGAELADPALDELGLTDGGLDELGLDELGLVAGLDGPKVAPGALDGLVSGVGFGRGVGLGRGVGPAHADELRPVTFTWARPAPTRPLPARLGLDGLALVLAWGGLAVLGPPDGDEPLGPGVAGGGLVMLALPLGDGPAVPGPLAGWGAGAATAGADDAQLAAGCPLFEVPCAAAAAAPDDSPPPGPPAPGWPPAVPPPVPDGACRMALMSAPACDHICAPKGVTADTLIATMSVIAATTAARRARPNRGLGDVGGGAAP